LRVHPRGFKAWVVIYSRHGRPRWLYLGSADAIGLADARMMAAEAKLAVAKGKDPAAEKRAEREIGTFTDLHQRYLEQWAKKRNKSRQQAEALIKRHVLRRLGKLQASSIGRSDIRSTGAAIEGPIVANRTLAAMSAIFSWAVKQEILPANPCKLVDRHPAQSRERVLSHSEVPRFWSAFDGIESNTGSRGRGRVDIGLDRLEHDQPFWSPANGRPDQTRVNLPRASLFRQIVLDSQIIREANSTWL
jgi:hypothetical protein